MARRSMDSWRSLLAGLGFALFLFLTLSVSVHGFTLPTQAPSFATIGASKSSDTTLKMNTFFKNLFAQDEKDTSQDGPLFISPITTPFDPSPQGLVERAKIILATDLGIRDYGGLLEDDFIFIGAYSKGEVLGKDEYLTAGKFFDLRKTFPDLDYRAHDFRIDTQDPSTVRLTARTTGNMRGELRLRNEIIQPNGKQMVCPPEAISITFNLRTGKVKKMCAGFVMDRLVGNTGGLCGVRAAATLAGSPPSEFEVYPVATVVSRFFGRPIRQLPEPESFLAPFPESVMIQLAKGIIAAQMASADPDLLGTSFSYCGAREGPLNKDRFLEKIAPKMFGGADPDLSHFRVDPYDPYRVWVDVRARGTLPEGGFFETPPQAMSFTFDDDGFCSRITGDAVMDPSIGNTGGLGGIEGIKYATSSASPEIATRPLPQVLGRLKKRVLKPFTKIGVDEYILEGSQMEELLPTPPTEKPPVTPLNKLPGSLFKLDIVPPTPPTVPQKQVLAFKRTSAGEDVQKVDKSSNDVETQARGQEARKLAQARAEEKKRKEEEVALKRQSEKSAAQEKKRLSDDGKREKSEEAAKANKQKIDSSKQLSTQRAKAAAKAEKDAQMKKSREAVAAKKKEQVVALAEQKKQKAKEVEEAKAKRAMEQAERMARLEEERRVKLEEAEAKQEALAAEKARKAQLAAEERRQQAEERRRVAEERKLEAVQRRQQDSTAKKADNERKTVNPMLQFSRTLAVPERKEGATRQPSPSNAAPRGVPTLSRWRKNLDGSVTGLISGSKEFENNERITTSPIARGEVVSGKVIQTKSGSKYFLN